MRKFCLLTTGRAGSTALMDALKVKAFIATPSKDVDCGDNELVHPKAINGYYQAYGELTGRRISSPVALIDAFYHHHRGDEIAGFKTMFNRHPNLQKFINQPDIQFITLRRGDIPSTIASFLAAIEHKSWRRDGGEPDYQWTFGKHNQAQVKQNIIYLFRSHQILGAVPDAIALTYEALCDPHFQNQALDDFFGFHVALAEPKSPTAASSYVTNWEEFEGFVTRQWESLAAR